VNLLPANIVDVAIILFLIYSVFDGWRRGLLALVADLVALVLSIIVSLEVYKTFAPFIGNLLHVNEQAGEILSFFLLAFILGTLLSFLFGLLLKLVPPFIKDSLPDRLTGAILGVLRGFVYVGIVLLLLSALPVLQPVKEAVAGSRYAPAITSRAKVIASQTESYLKSRFGGLVEDTFALLTIKPGEAGVDLGFKTTKFYTDSLAEEEMVRLLNEERTNRGLVPLTMDWTLREAARAHSRDMFKRGYFSHETPEGLPGQGTTPAARLDERGVHYTIMGENLALAPDVDLAHKGLMNSESHRENILFPEYRNVGIGAINGGIYGIMFSQEFTD